MICNRKATLHGNFGLAAFDFRVKKFFYNAAIEANEVIVMRAIVELKHGFAVFKAASFEQAGLLKLG